MTELNDCPYDSGTSDLCEAFVDFGVEGVDHSSREIAIYSKILQDICTKGGRISVDSYLFSIFNALKCIIDL